ncbi:pentatricopeptide repeat-containing protein At2g06000 [Olea europaea var. sylvestris]|uniref:pentatricopeptide repeat-containing protein At2g06000 n=1 Tax=Olea europaea var. sylvestris TaxID=158386 RepID=UPI000C1CEB2B|nr:pentatricopeptide repeat-containing protein At2g06000 [Olea europaea var. sylvestris]XP_022876392.1 pentatricopeptide repeat-containing protein At2g06000 [Olea europaea var. sylvestris]XP_022876393.1 pentatricopeptide repeat-containing protein At2g06000 [Olea europaea var. sylvestris]XP_022876394.1 pentatricopeptide repeat-containing protein At2g06000 [Olea europaea var. sylvestris]
MPLWAQRVSISKIFSTAFLHGHAQIESCLFHSSTPWFVKVVCTLCVRDSQFLTVFNSDYFCKNLNPFIAFSVIQHVNSRLNNPRLAFSFFQYTRLHLNLIHSIPTFELLLRSLCQVGLHDLANLSYEYMKTDGFFPNSSVLDYTISSFVNAGRFRTAEEILISLAELYIDKDEVVSSFVCNNLLSLLCKRNQVDEAVGFFREHILSLRGFCPDTCSFNIIMRGLCKVANVDKAFEFFDSMRSFDCLPDLITYNTLINGLCTVGNVDRAQKLLREVQSQGEFLPDIVTYTSIISGYCKLGKMERAADLFDELSNRGIRPNLITFNVLIDGFGKKGEMVSASEIYERMVGGGYHPDVFSFTSLIDGHCRAGGLEQGLKLWDEMNERNVSPNLFTFSVLINALCKENRLNEARDLLRQMQWREDIIPQPFVYNPVIDGFSKAGNVDEANAIVAEMEVKGCSPDKLTFTILILGHCMKGRMSEAISIFDKMLTLGCVPDSITTTSLVSCLRKAGMTNEAYKIEQHISNDMQSGLSTSERNKPFRSNMDITVAV